MRLWGGTFDRRRRRANAPLITAPGIIAAPSKALAAICLASTSKRRSKVTG